MGEFAEMSMGNDLGPADYDWFDWAFAKLDLMRQTTKWHESNCKPSLLYVLSQALKRGSL